jgi:hypothetical protein
MSRYQENTGDDVEACVQLDYFEETIKTTAFVFQGGNYVLEKEI